MNAKQLARTLNRRFQTSNPFVICEAMGISIVFAPLKGNRGFFYRAYGVDTIYLDESTPAYEQQFVCAHELGHALMHADSNAIYLDTRTYQVIGKYERSADHFAAFLLWPDDNELIDYSEYSLEQLSAVMGLPAELVNWRYEQIVQIPEEIW